MFDELKVGGCLVSDRPAEEMTASVVRDLTSSCRQPGEVLRVEKEPAIGSEPLLIDLEPLRELLPDPEAAGVWHGGDHVEDL